ncbi:PREDICTED: transmembrane protein 140 isoform X2 [Pseudopodoces humilis]|uniref:transmembrane protein 140 isoform X2 n=1 Tax=Pseudopodoces humilis TaxID=181119 RepID=UPI0006B6A934|nr:PREDICTED: transmembrane protein 140 isoform X2 [Pseudopodoces humilis]
MGSLHPHTMVARNNAGRRMGLLQQRCNENLLCVLTLLEMVGTTALMTYALLYEAGNLVNLPDKWIGFYNFCLWNDSAGELQCLDSNHLQAMGISPHGMELALVCVYASLVPIPFHILYLLFMNCPWQRGEWKWIGIIAFTEMIILFVGLAIFLFQTSRWIHLSDFTGGFPALLASLVLLLLQILTAIVYLRWAKQNIA